jgi:hypothetical protein
MKKMTSKEFQELFEKITPGKWNIKKVNNTLKIYNETSIHFLSQELDLKVLDHVHDGEYTVVSVLGECAKAGGLIRFCTKLDVCTMQWNYHYELVSGGDEYVKSLNGTYFLAYYADRDKIVTHVNI